MSGHDPNAGDAGDHDSDHDHAHGHAGHHDHVHGHAGGHGHHDHAHGHGGGHGHHDHAGGHGHHDHVGGHGHHDHAAGADERSLRIALALTGGFFLVELAGGWLSNSLALLSDAAHMMTDVAALVIALAAIRIGRRPADARRSFGYARYEVLAAAFNALLLFAAAIWIVIEAWHRLHAPPRIGTGAMLVVAVLGLLVNLASLRVLSAGRGESLNVRGAYLEVLADAIGSAGVIVGALLVRWTGLTWIDTAVAIAIGLWVVPRTWTLLRSSVHVLLEGVPDGVDLHEVRTVLVAVDGVRDVHDLHVWAVSSRQHSLTAHVVHDPSLDGADELLPRLRARIRDRFGITHVTLQLETEPCGLIDEAHHFQVRSS